MANTTDVRDAFNAARNELPNHATMRYELEVGLMVSANLTPSFPARMIFDDI